MSSSASKRRERRRAAEARALVADHGLDCAHERTGTHHAHANARLREDLRDDLGVREVRHDLSVLDRIAAHDARGGHDDVNHGVARVGKLVDALERLCAAVELAGIRGLHDHHAAALDAVVAGVDGHGHVVGDCDVGDEAAALLDAQLRLLAILPLRHAHAPAENARIDAHVWKRLRERERPAPRLASLVAGCATRHVVGLLLVRAEFGDWPHRETVHERGRRGAVIDPAELVGEQRRGEVLRTVEQPAVFLLERARGDARGVKRVERALLLGRPIMSLALSASDELGHDATRHATCARDGHLNIIPFGKAPHYLTHLVSGEHLHRRTFGRFCHVYVFSFRVVSISKFTPNANPANEK